MRPWLILAGVNGATAVAMAAYASHGLAGQAGQSFAAMAAEFQLLHAILLIGVDLLARRHGGRLVHAAGLAILVGILLFCGSLYARALLPVPPLPTTPMGGISLMAGWLLLAVQGLRDKDKG